MSEEEDIILKIFEDEESTTEAVTATLNMIVDQIVADSSAKPLNILHEEYVFCIGQSFGSGSYNKPRKRSRAIVKETNHNKRAKTNTNKKKTNKTELTAVETKEPKVLVEEMVALFINENPIYVSARASQKVYTKPNDELLFIRPLKAGHIKIIMKFKQTSIENFFAYQAIAYKTGNLFDWQVILGELDIGGELFNLPKSNLKIKGLKPILNQTIYQAAEKLFSQNQALRWQLKRLVNAWLTKKCKQRVIGEDGDLITGEPIEKDEQCRIISIKCRTTYVFSGHVLLKTTKSCLESQVGAIPNLKAPCNPYTNTTFSYGEMVHVYREILSWCAKKGKALPGIIALYREYKFKNYMLVRINHNYLQLKAVEAYILNDDTRGEFFVEAMEALLEEYEIPLSVEFDTLLIGYQRFRLWNILEPQNPLLITWKKFAADFWYYKQTDQFPRENWRNESSIYVDVLILLRYSITKLHWVMKEYYKRRQTVS
jgi:hypothetical protein